MILSREILGIKALQNLKNLLAFPMLWPGLIQALAFFSVGPNLGLGSRARALPNPAPIRVGGLTIFHRMQIF